MHYVLSADQKAFFEKHGFIEFEGLIPDELLADMKKCKGSGTRDVSRQDPKIKKIITGPQLSKLVADFSMHKRLRFAYDEVYELPSRRQDIRSLAENSCIQGLVCGLMICLEGEGDSETANRLPCSPYPKKPGSATLFLATSTWDESLFQEAPKQRFLLIAYALPTALYVYNEKDPHTHLLKKLGYVFGDRLNETCHPTLSR